MTRLAKLLPAFATLALLGACATAPDAASSDALGWFVNVEGSETKLAYGAAQSDDAPLMMACRNGSGRVRVSRDAARPGDGVTLASGTRLITLRGSEQPDMMNEGVIVTVETDARSPVLTRFRDTGRLALITGRDRAELPTTAAERQQIGRFFQACASA